MSDQRPTLLIVDDDDSILQSLPPFLERSGFRVSTAQNGARAFERIRSTKIDLILLDVVMPGMDGREVLRKLRAQNLMTPTILLSQIGESAERAMALREGADDYINKPFDPHELLARIDAVLRRALAGQPPISSAWRLRSGDLHLNRRARKASLKDRGLDLSPKAFAVLEYLMSHPEEVVSRDRLLEQVWGWDYPVGARTVDTRIFELRRALHDDASQPTYIQTVATEGYSFIAPVTALI